MFDFQNKNLKQMITNNLYRKKQIFIVSHEVKVVTMKAVIILVYLCICYSSAVYVTTLGDCTNYPLVGNTRVYEKAYKDAVKKKTIKFPTVSNLK